MTANLNDVRNSWELSSTGKYIWVGEHSEDEFSAHQYFMENPSLSGRGKALNYNAPKELARPKRQRKKKITPEPPSDMAPIIEQKPTAANE